MTPRIYRRPDVERITGLSRSSIYDFMARDRFPRPVKLGKRAVGWRACDVHDWLDRCERSTAWSPTASRESAD